MEDNPSGQGHNLGLSAALTQRARAVMPGGASHNMRYRSPHPIYFGKAEGAHKWDVEGRRYIDFKMGSASQMLGHCPPKVVEAVRRQMGEAIFTGDCHPLEVESEPPRPLARGMAVAVAVALGLCFVPIPTQ